MTERERTARVIERIMRYESLLDEAGALLASGQRSERLTEAVQALEAYYTSDEWKRDFADDEAGKLPKSLKRGVLSEDGIDRLLEAFYEDEPENPAAPLPEEEE